MNAPTKRWLWIALAPTLAVVIVMVVMAARWGPRGPELPHFDAAEISFYDAAGKRVTSAVAPGDLGRLRTNLESATRDRRPAKWQGAGSLRLLQSGSEVLQIDLYKNGSGRLPFRIGGEYYLHRPGGLLPELLETSRLPSG